MYTNQIKRLFPLPDYEFEDEKQKWSSQVKS
jgi:hypothetical protein